MTIITQKDIKEINRLYLELHTYAAVARATGFSPSTVKKYVINGYSTVDESTIKRFDRPLPDFSPNMFHIKDWALLCSLSETEEQEIVELWKELEV